MKKLFLILPLALILCFMVGCQDKEAMADLEVFKAQAEIEGQNKALAIRYIEAINNGNFDAFKELLSTDFAIYSPSGFPEPTSREKLIENYEMAMKAFTEFTWNIEDIIAAGDKVIIRVIISGIFQGEVPDLPTKAIEVKFSLISIMRMENGRIAEEWQEDDQLGLVRQLGMELKPKEAEK
jgi:steroid delta-isomerase-like uncharacterized protein